MMLTPNGRFELNTKVSIKLARATVAKMLIMNVLKICISFTNCTLDSLALSTRM